jgi:hypothetical protein
MVARTCLGHLSTDALHDAGSFVTQDNGTGHLPVTYRQIGVTHPHASDPHKYLIVARLFELELFDGEGA